MNLKFGINGFEINFVLCLKMSGCVLVQEREGCDEEDGGEIEK